MRIEKIARKDTGLFSGVANTLVYDQDILGEFIQAPFSLAAFKEQIALKKGSYSSDTRVVLKKALQVNYAGISPSDFQKINLEKIGEDNTFTVTTGHQLSLFTGPLYFIIKILHAINLSEKLKEEYPEMHFVPLFWLASEDHDFEEINHLHIFNQKLEWQTQQKGAVGRFELTEWEAFTAQFQELFKNHPKSEVMDMLAAYKGKNLGEATFNFVNALFAKYGLLVLDADNPALKHCFAPIVKAELLERKSQVSVQKTNEKLEKAGFGAQAHAREINLFLLSNQSRERIQYQNGKYFVEGQGEFSEAEILALLEKQPERFSPNVILRPVYQEEILPNLCYLGGGGEMAYWLQLKTVFENYEVPFPLIQVRNSLLMIDHATSGKIATLNWMTPDLFKDSDYLKKNFVLNNTKELDFTALQLRKNELVQTASDLVMKVDANMKGYLEGEMTRLTKQMENLQEKLIRAEKSKFESSLKQMDQIKEKLFPSGGLQERKANFFQFCADGQVFSHLEKFKSAIDPFEKDFIVCYY